MTNEFDAMDDYLGDLERHLRAQAVAPAPSRCRRRLALPALVVPVAAAGAVLVALLVGAFGGNTPSAHGRPVILDTPTVDVPVSMRGGLALQLAAGRGKRLDDARPIAALGDDGYLLSGDDAWCLAIPDPAIGRPDAQPGVGCTDTREFMQTGIALVVRRRYVAVVAQGVPHPIVTRADGQRRELHPDSQGVVVATLARGESVTRYGVSGQSRVNTAQ